MHKKKICVYLYVMRLKNENIKIKTKTYEKVMLCTDENESRKEILGIVICKILQPILYFIFVVIYS